MPTVSTFTALINSYLPEPHAGLLSGILFGVKATIDRDLYTALVATGTLHIIALSGMNITIITKLINVSLLFLLPRKIAVVATIGLIAGFIAFVGISASVIRAAIMGIVTLIGAFFGKPVLGLWSWGLAVVLMLLVKPLWITDLSFQLSVLASLGMIVFGEGEKSSAHSVQPSEKGLYFLSFRKPEGLSGIQRDAGSESGMTLQSVVDTAISPLLSLLYADFRTTLAAQVFTIPLILFTFGRISLIAPIVNALIVWTIPIITVLGILLVLAGSILYPLGQPIAWVAWLFLEYVVRIIIWSSGIPFASVGT